MGVFICRLNWIAFILNKENKMQSSAASPEALIKQNNPPQSLTFSERALQGIEVRPVPSGKTEHVSLESQGDTDSVSPPLWFSARVEEEPWQAWQVFWIVITKLDALGSCKPCSFQRCS